MASSSMNLSNETNFSHVCQDGESVINMCKDSIIQSLTDVITAIEPKSNWPITIADFGTADGSMVIPILNEAISLVRQKYKEKGEIVLIFEEQPQINYDSLVKTTSGLIPNQEHILNVDDNVFVLYSAKSMYNRCCPRESLDLVISTMALQFLSKIPCKISNGMFNTEANAEEQLMFKQQAKDDYKAFLISRAQELKHGGKMVLATIATFPDGRITEPIEGGFSTLSMILRELRDSGSITQKEYENITYPIDVGRTEEELRHPFESKDEDILRLGLTLDSVKLKTATYLPGIPDEIKDESALEKYVESLKNTNYAGQYNTVYAGLDEQRSEEDRKCIAEKFFEMVANFGKRQPLHPPIVVRFAEIIISKI